MVGKFDELFDVLFLASKYRFLDGKPSIFEVSEFYVILTISMQCYILRFKTGSEPKFRTKTTLLTPRDAITTSRKTLLT